MPNIDSSVQHKVSLASHRPVINVGDVIQPRFWDFAEL
jgi:hypothetical protein